MLRQTEKAVLRRIGQTLGCALAVLLFTIMSPHRDLAFAGHGGGGRTMSAQEFQKFLSNINHGTSPGGGGFHAGPQGGGVQGGHPGAGFHGGVAAVPRGEFHGREFHGGDFQGGHPGEFHGQEFHERFHHHHGFHGGVLVAPALGGWWWGNEVGWPYYEYPYESYYGYEPSAQYWYYCADPAGYYPYVTQCNTVWQAVPAG
jgi:hypothetical protein